jgi:hypothetical protein
MSYDIRFGVKVDGADDVYAIVGRPEFDSPTYNIREIFVKSMDWDYHQSEWYPVKEVLPKIEQGIKELTFNSNMYRKYEPDNGWGTVGTALRTLTGIYKWIKDDDFARGWNADIPVECLYMTW